MKKLLLFAALAVFCLDASAQEKAVWNIRAGINVSTLTLSEDGMSITLRSRASFNLGVALQQPLMKTQPLYLETGLYFTGRGAKEELTTYRTYYLQLPIMLSWHL